MDEFDLPRTLFTYSSYFDTLTAIAYLSDRSSKVYPASLASKLGKSNSTVSEQINGYFSDFDIIRIDKIGRQKNLDVNMEQLKTIYISWYKSKIAEYEQDVKEMQETVSHYVVREDLGKDVASLFEPEKLGENQIFHNMIQGYLLLYGESVLQKNASNRGLIANQMNWSLRDFFKKMTQKSSYFSPHTRNYREKDKTEFSRYSNQSIFVGQETAEKALQQGVGDFLENHSNN
jgi:hypothetical protein